MYLILSSKIYFTKGKLCRHNGGILMKKIISLIAPNYVSKYMYAGVWYNKLLVSTIKIASLYRGTSL